MQPVGYLLGGDPQHRSAIRQRNRHFARGRGEPMVWLQLDSARGFNAQHHSRSPRTGVGHRGNRERQYGANQEGSQVTPSERAPNDFTGGEREPRSYEAPNEGMGGRDWKARTGRDDDGARGREPNRYQKLDVRNGRVGQEALAAKRVQQRARQKNGRQRTGQLSSRCKRQRAAVAERVRSEHGGRCLEVAVGPIRVCQEQNSRAEDKKRHEIPLLSVALNSVDHRERAAPTYNIKANGKSMSRYRAEPNKRLPQMKPGKAF